MKMESLMTLRLPKEDLKAIEFISAYEKKDKSTAARELVELGRVYFAVLQYNEGRISIGKAAEIAGMPLSEMIELLAKLSIRSKIELEDYLTGIKTAEKLISGNKKNKNNI